MIGLLFLFLSLWVGFIVEDEFDILEKNFWAKLSFAIIVGSFLATWLTFALSLLIGFTKFSIYLSLLIMAIYVTYSKIRRGKNILWFREEVLINRSIPLVHVLLLLFIMPFFIFGVWETKSGDIMYYGNYTDLSYHLSIISSFIEQTNFLPENPQSAGAKMSYHFLVNFHSAILHLGGFDLFLSVIIPQILFSFALATVLYYFYKLVLKSEIATFFSVFLLIMGHIAFFNFLFAMLGHPVSNMKFDVTSWPSIREQLLFPFFNFLDPIINYFHPQRPFLFAFSLALMVLSGIYKMFLKEGADNKNLFFLALLIGLTPLFHTHTFLVIVPVLIIAALYKRGSYKWTFLSLIPLILAIGQIWFILSQPKAPGFSGFDVHTLGGGLTDLNILDSKFLTRIVFWIRAAGFPLIVGCAGLIVHVLKNRVFSLHSIDGRSNTILLIFFTIPLLFFLLINFYRFSPNWGDSNKFFLYFDVMLAIFAGKLLGSWFKKNRWAKTCAVVVLFIAAIGPSLFEAYVVFSKPGSLLFTGCNRNVAFWIKLNTSRDAVFLTSDDVIHYVPSLAGRRVVDGSYTWNTGFKKPGIDSDVRTIYRTGNRMLLRRYGVTHLLVGPQERRRYTINEEALEKYTLVYDQKCRRVSYKIYDVAKKSPQKIRKKETLSTEDSRAKNIVFLSDMIPVRVVQGYSTLRVDANIYDTPIILNGKRYIKGLGTHASSEIVFQLNRSFSYFKSDVGLDDTEDMTPGSVVFKVYVDGRLKYKTPVMRWDSETEHIKVDIVGAEELKLTVEDAGDGNTCDHASWAGAIVY